MSKKHLERVLLIVIGVELVALTGAILWAAFLKTAPPPKSAPAPETPAALSVLQPELFAQGLTRPTAIASTNDSSDKRLFVAEQTGTIRTLSPQGKLADQPLLDIHDKVLYDTAERGLLGVAFHPNYKQNGYLYVDYVSKGEENSIIARFTVSKQTGLADPASEKLILKITQPHYPNHKGGALVFGPDGYLYIGVGDGGSGGDPDNRAQNKNELLGKILRIDVDHGDPYAIPASNPFKKDMSVKPEIWAYGLRNPWRMSFDKQTHDLYIADVGQSNQEEIDWQKAGDKGGENYGWRCYEGMQPYNGDGCQAASKYVMPVLAYGHTEGRCSVVGGYVYRGTKYKALQGKYVYGDYCGGQVYYAQKALGTWQTTQTATTKFGISTFGQDSMGELYVADINTGNIYHIIDSANQ